MGMLIRIVVGAGELLMMMMMVVVILGRPVVVATAGITIRGPATTRSSSAAVQTLPGAVDTGIGTLVAGGAAAAGEVASAQGSTSAAGAVIATPIVAICPGSPGRGSHSRTGGQRSPAAGKRRLGS